MDRSHVSKICTKVRYGNFCSSQAVLAGSFALGRMLLRPVRYSVVFGHRYMYLFIYTYIHMLVRTYTDIYIYIYIHTYIHTHLQ